MSGKTLRFVLGDQLTRNVSSLADADPENDIILMCEVMEEATYVRHHPKKIAFLFSAMRHFAKDLRDKGFTVDYTKLDDPENENSFTAELKRAVDRHQPQQIIATFPGEYRVLKAMQQWESETGISVEIRADDRFLSNHEEFMQWAENRKSLRMEYYYREMRQKHGILMNGEEPVGGEWNFDSDNRKSLPKNMTELPTPIAFQPDNITQEVLTLVKNRFSNHFGELEPFHLAVTREEALRALNQFFDERFVNFGAYQDAMKEGDPFLFHSHISMYLNAGLLTAREVIKKAEQSYENGDVPINAAEGFIRQILGWREFIRNMYWANMPGYDKENALNATRPLPAFFWDETRTDMNCLKQCIKETRENAYAHHIQRLMVTGNFCLIAGIDPAEVNEWYLVVYADAYEWVEMPNVTGMILYADDGQLATKPYAAGGAYINRMSDYCKNCAYNVKDKTGENACPFNYLYWNFLMEHDKKLRSNQRMSLIYGNLDKMDETYKNEIKSSSRAFFKQIGIES